MLPTYVCAAGYAAAGLVCAADMRRLRDQDVPKLALLASTFFAASLVHVPVGPASVHLTLSGLVGLVAGPGTMLVVAAGLLLQALLFAHGGVTILGINLLTIGLPALLLGTLCRWSMRSLPVTRASLLAGLVGALIPAASLAMVLGWSMLASDPAYKLGIWGLLVASAPVCLLEGLICGATVSYILKVQPSVLGLDRAAAGGRALPIRPGP